jgi:hypothetical protein
VCLHSPFAIRSGHFTVAAKVRARLKTKVRALLDRAQAAGVKPNGLYLSALRLHPGDLPLPPDPRLVLEVPTALRRRYVTVAIGRLRRSGAQPVERRAGPNPRHRRGYCTARRRPHGR